MSTHEISVMRIELAEWPALRDLRARALADSPNSFGSSRERESAYSEADWIDLMGRGAWFRALSADGDSLGVAAGIVGDGLAHDEAHLVSFWVAPSGRGSGAASELLAAVRGWARSIGVARLTLWVADESIAARRFYTRMGFVGTGRRQQLPSNPDIGEEFMSSNLSD